MTIEAALFGTLSRDAESKVSTTGKPYLRITGIRTGDGDKVQWVSVTAFDQDAIAAADKFVKGARVYIEGKLSLDKWKAADGSDRSGLSVMSWHCRLAQIGRNKTYRHRKGAAAPAPSKNTQPAADFNDELPGWTP
jgi:single-stranded DNA-binding protein